MSKSQLTWVIGVIVTLAVCIAAYFWHSDDRVTEKVMAELIIGTSGLTLTIVCEIRVKLSEIEHTALGVIAETEKENKIRENSHKDDTFLQRYGELREEITELAAGAYHLRPLSAVYKDDISTIDSLRSGEYLRSTCPISTTSKEEARDHIGDPLYVAAMKSHQAAAQRGVFVTRLYFFKSQDFFEQAEIKTHLSELAKTMDIRVVFLDKVPIGPEFDFLVFGDRKVSVGVVDPGTGKVWSARASILRKEIERYTKEYEHLKSLSLEIKKKANC